MQLEVYGMHVSLSQGAQLEVYGIHERLVGNGVGHVGILQASFDSKRQKKNPKLA